MGGHARLLLYDSISRCEGFGVQQFRARGVHRAWGLELRPQGLGFRALPSLPHTCRTRRQVPTPQKPQIPPKPEYPNTLKSQNPKTLKPFHTPAGQAGKFPAALAWCQQRKLQPWRTCTCTAQQLQPERRPWPAQYTCAVQQLQPRLPPGRAGPSRPSEPAAAAVTTNTTPHPLLLLLLLHLPCRRRSCPPGTGGGPQQCRYCQPGEAPQRR